MIASQNLQDAIAFSFPGMVVRSHLIPNSERSLFPLPRLDSLVAYITSFTDRPKATATCSTLNSNSNNWSFVSPVGCL
ncbi:hypothetical protein H6F98_30200 [Microcoleus sp. FACHB-SPT15]|uniref:hypothetical protein n=1 Tax=Microcoleus sp. FACHB-SPT15 TaxID=2692830 RepID=UPI00177FFC90|nr:hypothetical protein [Microcoleus sp. FACHB-SPT15]MBD1809691.1 hypothetical protein [Microcoleus sp. FACHB-SPT15]